MKKIAEFFDFFFNKLIPKKLLVFIIATIFLDAGKISGDAWTIIAGAYLGTNILRAFISLQQAKDAKNDQGN